MGTTIIKANTVHFISAVLLDNNGKFESGIDIDYEVRKIVDDSLVLNGSLSEITNAYIASINLTDLGEYNVYYFTPTGYEDGAEQLIVRSYTIDDAYAELLDISEKLCRVLGLSQENFRIIERTYGTFGENVCLTSAKTRIYASKSDAENDINPIAEYQMTATYDAVGKLTDYLMVKI